MRIGIDPWNTFGGGAYDLAPAFALVGLLLAGMFDTVLVNTQEAALIWTLVALCVPFRAMAPVHARCIPTLSCVSLESSKQ